MSTPQNPLGRFNTYVAKHVLMAFKYTADAEQTKITPGLGNPGDVIVGSGVKGPGIVVANDFTASDFNVYSANWTWNFYGALTQTACSCTGYIEITDRTGMHFVDFLKTKVIPALGVSQGHIVFALRTFFIGSAIDSDNNDIIVGNPLIFNMATFVNDLSPNSGRFYTMSFVASSNTFAQLNQYSKLYQMTITHNDGGSYNEAPVPNVASCSLLTRKAENALQNTARKTRIDKSKPMRTLQEVFTAFEADLNQQKFVNVAQLQTWLQHVNNDYAVKIIPPIQQKLGQIPLDFFVHLDPIYNTYPVDNRNLPFEQPDQDQNKKGIRSIPVTTGTDIPICVEKLMKLSRKVGQDAELASPLIFKTVMSTIKTNSDRYQIHIVIKQIKVPENTITSNTGPGDGAITPLQFVFQDPRLEDRDIIGLQAKVTSDVGVRVLEKQTDAVDSLVVYGDREQITAERLPDEQFFSAQFSGLRAMVNPYENYGLESGVDAAKIDNAINVELRQQTSYSITTMGNPALLSDLNRLPTDVAMGNIGNAQYYKYPELIPMYVKLAIYLKPFAVNGLQVNENVANKFYYDNYLFLYRVTNKFEQGQLIQKLDMLRTDRSI